MYYLLTLVLIVSTISCRQGHKVATPDHRVKKIARAAIQQKSIANAHKLWEINSGAEDPRLTIQAACEPKIFHSKTDKIKGVIVLFHGYTACPQQFFSWAEKLTEESFEVLLPLQPGHGYSMVNGKDVTSFLPEPSNYERVYDNYIENINQIMRAYPDHIEKYVGGISFGATIAADALNHAPNLYDKPLSSPSFEFSNLLARLSLLLVETLTKISI